jgi:hypothetical protein
MKQNDLKQELRHLLRVLERAGPSRTADGPVKYPLDFVGPPAPISYAYACGYVHTLLERLNASL